VRTSPDGALWVVDMYRFVIEHPRWIPNERLAKLDVRAGDDKGRIYRVFPKGASLRKVPKIHSLNPTELAQALDSPNGPLRDLLHRELMERQDASASAALKDLARVSSYPAVRAQALSILSGTSHLEVADLQKALGDPDPRVV